MELSSFPVVFEDHLQDRACHLADSMCLPGLTLERVSFLRVRFMVVSGFAAVRSVRSNMTAKGLS